MQWRDATVSRTDATGYEAYVAAAMRQEPDVRQGFDQVGPADVANQFTVAGSATALPVGLDLPCAEDPELFFAESPEDVETAKAMCRGCKARLVPDRCARAQGALGCLGRRIADARRDHSA